MKQSGNFNKKFIFIFLIYCREIIQKIYAGRQRNALYFLGKGVQNNYASCSIKVLQIVI